MSLEKPRQTPSQQDFLKELKSRGMRFEPSPYHIPRIELEFRLQTEVGYTTLEYVSTTADTMVEYLGFPTIVEAAGSIPSYQDDMPSDLRTLLGRNRLEVDNLYQIERLVETLAQQPDLAKSEDPLLRELVAHLSHAPSLTSYAEKSLEEKLATVREMDIFCMKFLNIVTRGAKNNV